MTNNIFSAFTIYKCHKKSIRETVSTIMQETLKYKECGNPPDDPIDWEKETV